MNGLDPGAIAAQLGLQVMRRHSPKALDWIKSRTRGITLLLVGPSGSGKTTFFEYLHYGILSPESQHLTTVETTWSKPVSLPIGQNEHLKLHVRRTLDTPGQYGANAHANLIDEVRPHAVLLILDSTARVVDLRDWTRDFCVHADRVFRRHPARKRKIRSLVVCLNKADKENGARYFPTRSHAVRACLVDGLTPTLGAHRVQSIPILRCVSVLTSQHGSRFIDAAIAKLAMQVK